MRKNTRPKRRSPGLESLEERALLSGFFGPVSSDSTAPAQSEPLRITVVEVVPRSPGVVGFSVAGNSGLTSLDFTPQSTGLHTPDLPGGPGPLGHERGGPFPGPHAFDLIHGLGTESSSSTPDSQALPPVDMSSGSGGVDGPLTQDTSGTQVSGGAVAEDLASSPPVLQTLDIVTNAVLTPQVVVIPVPPAVVHMLDLAMHSHEGPFDRGPDGPGVDHTMPGQFSPAITPRLERPAPTTPAPAPATPADAVSSLGLSRDRGHGDPSAIPGVDVAAPVVIAGHASETPGRDALVVQYGMPEEAALPRPTSVVTGDVPGVHLAVPAPISTPGGMPVESPLPGVAGEGVAVAVADPRPVAPPAGESTGEPVAEVPIPLGSGLIAEVLPFDATAIEQSVARFLEQFEPVGSAVETPANFSMVPKPILVIAVAASFEASRRWLLRRRKGEEQGTLRERGLAFYGFS